MESTFESQISNLHSQNSPEQKQGRLNVLLIAPYYDMNVAGEAWCTYKWVEGISKLCDTTVLTTHTPNWDSSRSPIDAKTIVNWTHKKFKGKLGRFDNELKPHYIRFYLQARKWIKTQIAAGVKFDLIHQISPVALRYPSPATGLGIPYILGPHAGSLETPEGFKAECPEGTWFRQFRNLDRWRVKHDPILRRSFSGASLVLGVAPYVEEFLRPAGIRRFEIMAETGPAVIIDEPKGAPPNGRPLRLLFVGRVIRTKGTIDAVRAVAIASRSCDITLDVLGTGDMLEACKAEAVALGVSDRITFHGRVSRDEVFEWYKKSDVFLFPSFREPSGTVIFEALGFGLPIITSTAGGPGHVVTSSCGITIDPKNPKQFSEDIAATIFDYANNKNKLVDHSRGAICQVLKVASWKERLNRLKSHYLNIIQSFTKKPNYNSESNY